MHACRRLGVCLSLSLLFTTAAAADKSKATSEKSSPADPTLGQRVWAVTDLVLDNHIAPPTRQEMLLAAVKNLLKEAGITPPHDLSRRVSAIQTIDQAESIIEQFAHQAREKKPAAAGDQSVALVEGLLQAVPGKSELLSTKEAKVRKQVAANRYIGTGIQITVNKKERMAQIMNPFRGGPARRAGSRPGDLIVRVDGKSTENVSLRTVVDWLRGEEGSTVVMDVRQPDSKEIRSLHVVRAPVPIQTVLGFRRASEDGWTYTVDAKNHIGYLCLLDLNSSTLHELRQAEDRLRAEGVRALVLDFRFGSSAGNMHDGELVADGLLDGGLMWRVREWQRPVKEVRADRECLFRDWPIAVLIDGSMVDNLTPAVAAAWQDNHRALLVGEATANDGMVKRMFELPYNLGEAALQTGYIERAAAGRSWPLRPDHEVALNETQRKAVKEWLEEKQLSELPAGKTDQPPTDPQLTRAVELLRDALKGVKTSARP